MAVCGALAQPTVTDPDVIICEYGTTPATRVTDSDEALCQGHAREHYGTDWRTATRTLGKRATARIAARYR